MTSRTIDIHCRHCRKYLFSLQPNDRIGIAKDYTCKSRICTEKEVVDKLKGKK